MRTWRFGLGLARARACVGFFLRHSELTVRTAAQGRVSTEHSLVQGVCLVRMGQRASALARRKQVEQDCEHDTHVVRIDKVALSQTVSAVGRTQINPP